MGSARKIKSGGSITRLSKARRSRRPIKDVGPSLIGLYRRLHILTHQVDTLCSLVGSSTAFTRPRTRHRIHASRGATTLGKPIIGRRAKREGNPPAKVWEVGTNETKDIIYQRLEIVQPAANGYQHFPKLGQFSEQYFAMLVSEESEMKRAGDGKFYRAFFCENGVRNEALDGRVGTMAAERIVKPNYKKLAIELAVTPKIEAPAAPKAAPEPRRFVRKAIQRRGGFARGWR
jgi:phage terminase large subunit GpA-like protein